MSKDYIFRISEIRQKQIVVRAKTEDEAEEKLKDAYIRGEIDFGAEDALTESMEIEHVPDDQDWIDKNGPGGYERLGSRPLAVFRSSDQKETFRILGSYEIVVGDHLVFDEKGRVIRTDYPYPEFSNLSAEKEIDGRYVPYKPNRIRFSGVPYEAEDMLMSYFLSRMMGDKKYEIIMLDPGLQNLLDSYCAQNRVATVIDGKPVLSEILFTDGNTYDLCFATDRYLYYTDYAEENQVLMFDTKTRRIMAEGTFAESGMWDSVENAKTGEETLLYGKLPERPESMPVKMVYQTDKGKVLFDHFSGSTRETPSYWVTICPECFKKYQDILGRDREDEGLIANSTCSVKGCWNMAEHCLGFAESEISFI